MCRTWQPRRWRTATRFAALASLLAAGGCASRFDPQAPAIKTARQEKVREFHTAVDAVVHNLPLAGTGESDVCEAGQDNPEVRDPYRQLCSAGYTVIVGLDATNPGQALSAAQQAITNAKCDTLRGLESDHERVNALGLSGNQGGRPTGPHGGYRCQGTEITVHLRRSDDESQLEEISGRRTGPYDLTVTANHLNAVQALRRAHQTGHLFVLAVAAGGEYYRVKK